VASPLHRPDELSHLVEEGIIDAVHSRLMSGKEATVYVVERQGHLGAAKVYKARDERTFKKTAGYLEGRNQTRNTRDRRAMQKKSTYGRGLIEHNWQDTEFHALRAAFDAGVRVPEPYFLFENVLFMELVVDGAGAPASRLADFTFTAEEATVLHQEIFLQVKGLLGTGRIHGDLSAYNVLMAAGGPTIIDMPQVVEVAGNNNARQILRRDLRNLTEHLARFDARLLRVADCGDALFHHLLRGTLDTVTAPEMRAVQHGGTAGRRGRDAERGRAGRDKKQRPGGGPSQQARPGGPSQQARPGGPSQRAGVPPDAPSRGHARGVARKGTGARGGGR
jgi:RIO kinase 1